MTYLDYIVFLEKCDQVEALSGNAYKLYHKLLAIANVIGWPKEFAKSDPYVAAVCSIAIGTMKSCRAELEARGLIKVVTGGIGRKAAATYKLLNTSKIDVFTPEGTVNASKIDVLPEINTSKIDAIESVNTSKIDAFTPEIELNTSINTSKIDGLILDKEKESSSAAVAATPLDSSSKKPATKKQKSAGATPEEIAALPLPFDGTEFVLLWTNFLTGSKQQGKTLFAYQLMLKHLAKKPEAFACVMLERATVGNWQGVENGGTPRDYAEWQAQEAKQPTPPAPKGPPIQTAPTLNPEAVAENETKAGADLARRIAEFQAQQQTVAA